MKVRCIVLNRINLVFEINLHRSCQFQKKNLDLSKMHSRSMLVFESVLLHHVLFGSIPFLVRPSFVLYKVIFEFRTLLSCCIMFLLTNEISKTIENRLLRFFHYTCSSYHLTIPTNIKEHRDIVTSFIF